MKNIYLTTGHIRKKVLERGGDEKREVLTFCPTVDGKPYYAASNGDCWRMMTMVENAYSPEEKPSVTSMKTCGSAFGAFQHDLADFDASLLTETIPHFHDTISRLEALDSAVKNDAKGRKSTCESELAFVDSQREKITEICNFYKGLPLRVTHNDTKINNVMLDYVTGQPVCVVDLDTVMPGYVANDFGDAVRFGASTAAEDEKDLSLVHFDKDLYDAFLTGFVSGFGEGMTADEEKSMPMGAYLMMMEVGIRFLTDYLAGDVYFKTDYPEHNLVRCRTQFTLAREAREQLRL